MKLILAIALLTLFSTSYSQRKILYYRPSTSQEAGGFISRQKLEEDLRFWQQVMEESHVNLYHAISKSSLATLKKKLLSELPDSITYTQSVFTLSRMVAAINEGHLGLVSHPFADSIYQYHTDRFPYLLRDAGQEGLVVERDISSSTTPLPTGARIISINGHTVTALYKKYSSMYGGLETWRRVQVKDAIRKLLFLDGVLSPFNITAVTGKDTLRFSVRGFNREQGDSISRSLAATLLPNVPFSLSFLPNRIGMIQFNDMDGSLADSFSNFLESSFKALRDSNAQGLIIDLRKNGGGSSALGDQLLSYITSKKYRNISAVKVRISSHSKELSKLSGHDDPFKDWKNGSIYEHKVTTLTEPAPRSNRFTGRVAVLIGDRTFSSANMLTNAIKDFQLATLIGQSTAEPGNDFGEIFSFMLPNTRMIASGAQKMFVRANGDATNFNGIEPDITVPRNSDPGDSKDAVLDAALEWLKK